jgi:hypothetical protein
MFHVTLENHVSLAPSSLENTFSIRNTITIITATNQLLLISLHVQCQWQAYRQQASRWLGQYAYEHQSGQTAVHSSTSKVKSLHSDTRCSYIVTTVSLQHARASGHKYLHTITSKLLEKLMVLKLVRKFPTCSWTRRLISLFTRTCHCAKSQASPAV